MNPLSSLLPWAGIPGSPQKTATKIKTGEVEEVFGCNSIPCEGGEMSSTQYNVG